MAAWDNVGLPGSPQPASYAAPLLDFSPLASLVTDYFKGTQMKRELELQKPINSTNPQEVAAEMLRRGGAQYAEQMFPFLQQFAAASPSPIYGGGGGGASPTIPSGAPPVAAAPGQAPSAISTPTPLPPPPQRTAAPVYRGGDAEGSVVSLIAARGYGDVAAGNVLKHLVNRPELRGIDPNQPLNPDQTAAVNRALEMLPKPFPRIETPVAPNAVSAAARPPATGKEAPAETAVAAPPAVPPTGIPKEAPAAAPKTAAAPPAPAQPAATPPQSKTVTFLPAGYSDPRQAFFALMQEARRIGANPAGREEAASLREWAKQIQAEVGGPRQLTVIGKDSLGNDVMGFVDPFAQTVKPAMPSQGDGQAFDRTATGAEFLKSLDPGLASQVKAVVEGRMSPPGSYAMKSPQMQALLRMVAQYEPGFDTTKWAQRSATAKDFASGKGAQSVTALNTVMGHLNDLRIKADNLRNFDGLPFVNKTANEIKNWIANNSGDPRVAEFKLARNAVSDELAKVFRSAGMSDAEIRQWKENLSESYSPAQFRGAISTAIGLIESRLQALTDQYNQGMNTKLTPREMLNEKSRKTLGDIEAWSKTEGTAKPEQKAKPTAAPPRAVNEKTGEVLVLKNGKWVPE